MRPFANRFAVVGLLAALLAALACGFDVRTDAGEKVGYASRILVAEGEIRRRGIVCVSCDVEIAGEIRRDVVVIGGRLKLFGTARDGVVGIFSDVTLGPDAVVEGDLVSIASRLDAAPEAEILGDLVDIPGFGFERMGRKLRMPQLGSVWSWLGSLFTFFRLVELLVLLLVLIVITALAKDTVVRAGNAVEELWLQSFLVGLVTYVAAITVGIILCVTIIGIPAALLLYLAVKVTKWIGMAALFYFVGDRIGRNLLKREFNLLGAMVLAFVVYALLVMVPLFWISMLISTLVAWMAVGLMITTRFGTGRPWFPAPAVPAAPPPAGVAPRTTLPPPAEAS